MSKILIQFTLHFLALLHGIACLPQLAVALDGWPTLGQSFSSLNMFESFAMDRWPNSVGRSRASIGEVVDRRELRRVRPLRSSAPRNCVNHDRSSLAAACVAASSLRLVAPPRRSTRRDKRHQSIGIIGKGAVRAKPCAETMQSSDATSFFSMDILHRPLEPGPKEPNVSLSDWILQAFDMANQEFFSGELEPVQIELDSTWHLRGGAGGAHPDKRKIVLDPSVHMCYRDLCATLLHEMLHLQIGDADDEEHGPLYLQACLNLNERIMASRTACFCRLGEFDTPLDHALLAKVGAPDEMFDALQQDFQKNVPCTAWDSGLLVGDFCEVCHGVGMDQGTCQRLAARIQCMAIITSCKVALKKGYVTWSLKSRTMAQYCARKVGRDYQSFSDYSALWSL